MPISYTERKLAEVGDTRGFWTQRNFRGDPLAQTALDIRTDTGPGSVANDLMRGFGIDDLNGLGSDLMNAHIRATDNDIISTPNFLNHYQIRDYHYNVFDNRSIPRWLYGGFPGEVEIPSRHYCNPDCNANLGY